MRMKILSIIIVLLTLCSSLQISAFAADKSETANAPLLTVSNIDSTTNRLTWTKVDGAASYIIYLLNEDTNKYEKYGGEMKGNSCRDKNLLPNTKYTYKVRAKFPDGSIGKMSEAVSIYTYNNIGRTPCNFFAVSQGEWVYFSSGYDGYLGESGVKYTLSKIKKDGSGLKKICNDYAVDINVIGEYIYYLDCETKCIKKINVDGSDEQVLLEKQDYVPSELIVTEKMIYYLLYYSEHEEASGNYDVYGMKIDGTGRKYICTLGEECYAKYIGKYNEMICFGYNERSIIHSDDEYVGFHTKNTGKYIIKGFINYKYENICSIENMIPCYAEVIDNKLYYSSGEDIIKLNIATSKNVLQKNIPAYHFKISGKTIAYTQYKDDEKIIHIVRNGEDTAFFKKGVISFSFFDNCAVILNKNGKLEIINYYDKLKKSA